jgi:hypothetical protein
MRARTPVIPLFAAALDVMAYRRALSRLASFGLAKGLALAAYRHSLTREHISQQDLLKRRSASEVLS